MLCFPTMWTNSPGCVWFCLRLCPVVLPFSFSLLRLLSAVSSNHCPTGATAPPQRRPVAPPLPGGLICVLLPHLEDFTGESLI